MAFRLAETFNLVAGLTQGGGNISMNNELIHRCIHLLIVLAGKHRCINSFDMAIYSHHET